MNLRLMHKAATTRGARVFVRHLTATLGFLLLTCFSPGSLKAAICFCHGERGNALCQKKKKLLPQERCFFLSSARPLLLKVCSGQQHRMRALQIAARLLCIKVSKEALLSVTSLLFS